MVLLVFFELLILILKSVRDNEMASNNEFVEQTAWYAIVIIIVSVFGFTVVYACCVHRMINRHKILI